MFSNFLIDINISNYIILLDFNFHYLSSLFPHTEFKFLINTLSLNQHVDFPTHIHDNCLNVMLTHEDSSIIKYNIPSDLITDHFAIICKLKMFKVNTDSSIVNYRNIKSINLDLFSSGISEYILIYIIDISFF